MKTVERHKKTDFGDVWYVNAIDGTYRFAIYKYDDDDDTIYLSNVFVKEDSRRQGYGNEILTSAEEYANRLGASAICLKVLSGSDVHRWYKRHGYEDLEKDEEERGYMWMKKDLKKVNESIWGDVQRRGMGIQKKKEDDVNLLSLEEFYEYIKKHYKSKVEYIDLDPMGGGNGDVLGVDITENVILFYKPKRGHILLSWSRVKIPIPFFDELTDKFKIENPNAMRRIITEKDGSCTNKTFIDVIDFFVKHIDDIVLKESIWGDVQRRGMGVQVKKEDELDQDDYDAINDFIFGFATRIVWDNEKESLTRFLEYIDKNPEALDCNIERVKKYVERNWFEGENLSDVLAASIEQEYKEKREGMYESIWGDVQRRGMGIQVKKEDITEEDKKDIDYIFNGFSYLIVYTDYEPTIDDFIKMMKEAYPDEDNSKYIAWVRSNWDKKYKDELDKKIQDDKKDLDKRIDKYLNNFVGQVVYCEKYNVSLPDIKKFSDEILKRCGVSKEMRFVGKIRVDESWLDIFKKYVDENWDDVKRRINDFIVEENQEIAKTGFKKTPGETIYATLDEWWDSLSDDEKDEIAWDEFGERAEEKYYERHNPTYNEYTGEDFDADEEWANASWIESVEIYMKYNQKTNESIWGDVQRRGMGVQTKKEDEMSDDDFKCLISMSKMFDHAVKYIDDSDDYYYSDTKNDFIKYIECRKEEEFWGNVTPETYDKLIKFVDEHWGSCKGIKDFMSVYSIDECDGVPGGLTPADVGGMGEITFPGPNGEPGSGDLPMPTGHVYQQVAPFGLFINMKKGKKRKKKFRKEDEPCVHSPNAKVYDYVDDYREYVDRTYNNMDRRK